MRDAIRVKHYSIRTEEAYVSWLRRYVFFHDKRHPRDMGVPEIHAFEVNPKSWTHFRRFLVRPRGSKCALRAIAPRIRLG